MTDSKTARELASEFVLEVGVLDVRIPLSRQSAVEKMVEKIVLAYASDKDNRIEQLEAEKNHAEDKWSDAVIRESKLIQDGLVLQEWVTSLKSSLAEKEAEFDHLRERHNTLHDQRFAEARKVDDLSAQLASLKKENERWQTADSKAVAALQSQLDENEKELIRLRLESEVKDEALKSVVDYYKVQGTGKIFCLGYGKDAEKENLVHKALLSQSTKSSLMEKVRNLCDAAESMRISMGMWLDFFDGHADPELCRSQHRHALKLYESALTEVKKEIGA